jgi:hypothetical protein
MKNKQNDCLRASALEITFPVVLISLLSLLTLTAAPAPNQMEQKPAGAGSVEAAWTTTGSMSAARHFHTATLLPNGTVAIGIPL